VTVARSGLAVLALVMGLAFQGSRGLWEPDEGFYGQVASEMAAGGDWRIPRLHGQPFLDKPPLLYWLSAGSLRLLGPSEWALRLPNALVFAFTALAVAALGRRLAGEAVGNLAGVVQATALAPFLAANVLTPDTLLAGLVVAVYWGYVEAEAATAPLRRDLAWLGAGVAAGLGILAKGPALLVFLPPLAVHLLIDRRLGRVLRTPGPWLAAAAALAIGLPWYLWIGRALPGASAYILDNQVLGRLATDTYARNHDPWDAVTIYLPTLLLGCLPWGAAALVARFRSGGAPALPRPWRPGAPALLWLWVALPLLVFSAARSRLPLYLLPVFPALSLLAAGALVARRAPQLWPHRHRMAIAGWTLGLLALKGVAAVYPEAHDSRAFAEQLTREAGVPLEDVVAVDAKRNALPFYGVTEFEWVRGARDPYPFFSEFETLEEEIREAVASDETHTFIVQRWSREATRRQLEASGLVCREGTGAGPHAVFFCHGPGV